MRPVVIFPDVELLLTGFLRQQLSGRAEPYAANVYVANAVPAERRDYMVIVRRDGGPRLDLAREIARVGITVWALKEQDATDLARLIAALVWASPDGAPILKAVQTSGPSPVVDASRVPQRYLTFELTVRGTQDA